MPRTTRQRRPRSEDRPYELLARFRHALRMVNGAIERGCRGAGLTVQQQAFLLAIKARGEGDVPLSDVRGDMGMDMATASELLKRLVTAKLVRRQPAADRRYLSVGLTPAGDERFALSLRSISEEVRKADRRGELEAMVRSGRTYLAYLRGAATASRPRGRRRRQSGR
ncbi:MAG: MarR family transcriptional regulator [Chloroflexota bacterium]|nr:MarR family transcriptional regulator [Chloroflexota bacterium]MDE3193896.1 MarR family transcriptional regulator [Chloroflexota bacterium]